MRLHNSHGGTMFSGGRQRKGRTIPMIAARFGAAGVNRFRTNGKHTAH